jgi:hypothetical protein
MMNRRSFLTGTLMAGAAAGTALFTATPSEVEAFGRPLIGPVTLMDRMPLPDSIVRAGELVFNHQGKPIGVIEQMTVSRNLIESHTFGSLYTQDVPGLTGVEYRVIGTGPCRIRTT